MSETLVAPPSSPNVIVKPEPPPVGDKADSLIAMRDIWKTYDMGAEKVHALHSNTNLRRR